MTTQEINEGIKLICETSNIIQNCYESKQALADEINNAKKEDIEKCWHYYKDRSGVVVDVRKELFKLIREGNIVTAKLLDDLVAKYKKGKENQFRVYKNFYTIFYPAITFYGHNPLREFVKNFENKLIVDLGLENEVKTTSFDFQGPRQQGSDRYWLAIYNKEQQNQSTGIQFFIDFHHGSMSYGVYKHGNRDYLKERVVVTPETFSYDDLLVYFKTEVNDLINDLPKYDNITSIDLGGHNLYKISHGTFKAKNKSHVIDSLKENNWITLHENTGKDQSRYFKEELHEGDYVYITLGSKELIGIAKIVSEEWDYVPYDIVDAEGWMFREVEFIKAPVRKNLKDLKDSKNIFPSGNSTLTEIRFSQLDEANDKLFKPYFNVEFYNSAIVTALEINSQKLNNILKPLNQILYGPPGTGKTYNTVLEAAKIVTGNETINYDEALQVFNENLNSQIEFITFHQNYSYEDFIQGLRPDITQNNHLSFERTDGVFMQIAVNALFEFYKAFQSRDSISKLKNIDVNEVYIDFFKSLKLNQEFKTKTKKTIYIDSFTKNQNIIFKYSEASKPATVSSERLLKLFNVFKSVEEINNINEDIRNVIGGCDATVYFTSLREFIDFYNKYKENLKEFGYVEDDYLEEDYIELNYDDVSYQRKKELLSKISFNDLKSIDKNDVKKYVIIIDEINRANISRVFGELITLIEEDKRSHGKIPMRVTLPSGDSFTVPSNLFIMGTMNTADKSISLLDIALRRRFEFVPMYPNTLIQGVNSPTVLETINAEIIKRKGYDFTIGHAYFMGEEYTLEKTINNKVIPLLLEYFMNDEKEVATILKAAEIEVIGWPMKMKTT